MAIKFDQLVAIEQPQQPGMIDPGEGPLAIAAEQVEWTPTEQGGLLGPAAIKEAADIVNELLPALGGHIRQRVIGMQPGEALCPGTRDECLAFNDCRALFFRSTPARLRL